MPPSSNDGPVAWITGAGGLIGNYLAHTIPAQTPWRVHSLTRAELDLTDSAAVRALARREQPQLIIHCAALSKSPACQADPSLARRINVEVTACLSEIAADARLVFLSTDLVFDGRKGFYVETDAVNPLSVYAETKVAAEQIVLANPKHTVVRTSLNGGQSPTRDRGFNEEMRQAWTAGKTLNFFTDEFRCPIPAGVTAAALWALVAKDCPGIYHLAGSERLSRWEIGLALARRYAELKPQLQAGRLRDYQGAPRSPDTSLDCAKFRHTVGFALPAFSRWLEEHPDEPF